MRLHTEKTILIYRRMPHCVFASSQTKSSLACWRHEVWILRRCPATSNHAPLASTRRPSSVIRTRATSIVRPAATTRSAFAVASPARISSTRKSVKKPCASMIASVQRRDCPRAIRARGGEWREGCACARAAWVAHRGHWTCLRDGDVRVEPRRSNCHRTA
jgi:hypothetical protein